jgi:hypothetical protein
MRHVSSTYPPSLNITESYVPQPWHLSWLSLPFRGAACRTTSLFSLSFPVRHFRASGGLPASASLRLALAPAPLATLFGGSSRLPARAPPSPRLVRLGQPFTPPVAVSASVPNDSLPHIPSGRGDPVPPPSLASQPRTGHRPQPVSPDQRRPRFPVRPRGAP